MGAVEEGRGGFDDEVVVVVGGGGGFKGRGVRSCKRGVGVAEKNLRGSKSAREEGIRKARKENDLVRYQRYYPT